MSRIIFISRVNLESGRTNVYNTVKTCEALNSAIDTTATLVTSDQKADEVGLAKRMFIDDPFNIIAIGVSRSGSVKGKLHEILLFLLTNIRLIAYLIRKRNEFDTIYFRDEQLTPTALFFKLLGKKTFFEIHSVLRNKWRQSLNKLAINCVTGVVAISTGLKKYYEKSNKNILISLCSAAEERWFTPEKNKNELRMELGLPVDKFIVGYTGVVGANPNGDYYELDDILLSLKELPDNVYFVVVGELNGNGEWLREIAHKANLNERIQLVNWQERSDTYKYLQAFDLVLVPRRKLDLIGDSPAKMFPALASNRPIIAGKSEFITEVLTHKKDALIVGENSPKGWSEAIGDLMRNKSLVETLVQNAQKTKNDYTWEKRGKKIANFIKQCRD